MSSSTSNIVIVAAVAVLFVLFGGVGFLLGLLKWALVLACVAAIVLAILWKVVGSED